MKELSTTPEKPKPTKEEPKKPAEVVNTTTIQEKLEPSKPDRPFSAEYFDVKDWGSLLLEPKLDVHGITSKVSFIEDYLSGQLKKNSMKCDLDSFKDILSDIENTLGIDSKHDLKYRISRVYGFLNVIKLTKEKEELRQKHLMAILKK